MNFAFLSLLFYVLFTSSPTSSRERPFVQQNFCTPSLGSSSICLHPSNPLPPCACISHLWENPEALHSLLPWLDWVSAGNGRQGCCAPGGQSLSAAPFLDPRAFQCPLPGWPSPGHRVPRRLQSLLGPSASLCAGLPSALTALGSALLECQQKVFIWESEWEIHLQSLAQKRVNVTEPDFWWSKAGKTISITVNKSALKRHLVMGIKAKETHATLGWFILVSLTPMFWNNSQMKDYAERRN